MKKNYRISQTLSNAVYDVMSSPVGDLTMIASPEKLGAILWDVDRGNEHCVRLINTLARSGKNQIIIRTMQQLEEYFEGKRNTFDLPIVLHGTDFQIKVWEALCTIPYAKTISYADQAGKIGDRKKARAVGMTNGKNPIPIVIPCHRVIGSNGKLVGFGGGLAKKSYLLQLEHKNGILL